MRDTRSPKTGMELAIMYAIPAIPMVQLSQVIQCLAVFSARCRVPLKSLTKMYLAYEMLAMGRFRSRSHLRQCE